MHGPSGTGKALRASAPAPYLLLGLLALIAVAIGGTAWEYQLRQKAAFESEVKNRLLSIADGKVRQIQAWRQQRLADARTLMEDPFLPGMLQAVISGKASIAGREGIAELLGSLCRNQNYAGILLMDLEGHIRLSVGQRFGDDAHLLALMRAVVKKGQVVESDFHAGKPGEDPHLGLNLPLRRTPGGPVYGVMMLSVDPAPYLRSLQEWPVPARSGEVLLVTRRGDAVVYMVDLKNQPGSAMNFKVPLTRSEVVAVQAVRGAQGSWEGKDYRGVPVFAAVRSVPDSPWYLIAKVDSEEVTEPMRRGTTMLGVAATSLAIALGALLLVLWRRHQLQVYRDLCESAEAHRALEAQYDYLSRFANDVIFLLGPDGAIVRANDRAAETYGYSTEELGRMNVRDMRTPEALAAFERDWTLAGERDSLLYESVHRSRTGREFPVEISMRGLKVEGRVFRQAIIRDISERKLAEMELSHSEARMRQLVEYAPYGIMVLDGVEILYVNPAAQSLFGAHREGELLGQSVLQFLDAEERAGVLERVRKFRSGEQLPIVERRYTGLDGREFWASVSATPIEYNECPATLLFYQDITERKRAAEQRALLEEQLRQSQKMESVGRLAGGVAHDFNNYLTVINGYCDMLLADAPEGGELRDGLLEIRAAGERAASVTMQLLAFSRKQLVSPRPFCLNQAVQNSTGLLSRLIGEQIEILTRLKEDLPLVMVDPGQIDQILMNLAINARDAMPTGGRIAIETDEVVLRADGAAPDPLARVGRYAVLAVSDTGIGIPPELQQKIFEPFFTTKGVGHGTGLGLCTAYGIAHHAGGWIEVESAPGQGAKFRVWLPVTEAAPEKQECAMRAPEAPPPDATLLVVEDQSDVRRLALSILKSEGYRLLEAKDGDEALEVSASHGGAIDLLVTDVVMPGMTGCQLADRLATKRPGMRVLYVSGYSGDATAVEEAAEAGRHYLAKPFTPEQLAVQVREIMRAPASKGTILVIDDDASVSALLRRILQAAGYRVLLASDGRMGMKEIERQPVDLVITDLVMPEQEGLETVSLLHAQRPALPVIAISGAFGGSFLKAAGMFGAAATLEKPIAAEDLLRAVERCVGRAPQPVAIAR